MGQTLTNGVYLPDEGERNCYAGLAANWNILDGAVGTVAEHTSALSGKAPLVHTHTKSDITDFPAYGNAAGTICEGNDSRLSDARTPVAHTHTKSDVTDLLNSDFIPSANNSYNLGSSSYQWSNLYAKNYFYNGVAWGLDKANTWTGTNSFYAILPTQNGGNIGNASSLHFNGFFEAVFTYNQIKLNGDRGAWIVPVWSGASSGMQLLTVDGIKPLQIGIATTDANNRTVLDSSQGYINIYTGTVGTNNKIDILPMNSSNSNLGSSTYKWKTLNSINPGALSLPDLSSGTGVSLSAGANSYSPPSSGWLSINLTGAISVVCGDFCHSGTDMISVPVVKGSTYTVTVATSGTAYLFVSQGNV